MNEVHYASEREIVSQLLEVGLIDANEAKFQLFKIDRLEKIRAFKQQRDENCKGW